MKISMKGDCRSCCPLANALEVLGDRWSLLVIRDLMLRGRHEYHEFMAGEEKIATNILSDRLKNLLCLEIIQYIPHPKHKSKKIYYLTQKGKDLMPVMMEMVLWGGAYHASPDMPKEHFNKMKRDPKKFMREALAAIAVWEKKNLIKTA